MMQIIHMYTLHLLIYYYKQLSITILRNKLIPYQNIYSVIALFVLYSCTLISNNTVVTCLWKTWTNLMYLFLILDCFAQHKPETDTQ